MHQCLIIDHQGKHSDCQILPQAGLNSIELSDVTGFVKSAEIERAR